MPEVTTVFDTVEPWSVYLFGEPGCGKTTLAAYAPSPLFLMFDRNGHRALRRVPEFHSIPMVRCPSYSTGEAAIDALAKNPKVYGEVETIVLDTWSRFQKLSNKNLLVKVKSAGRSDLSEFEFRQTNDRMEELMTKLLNTGLNTVFLAHEKEEKDDKGETIVIRPANSEGTMGTVIAQTDGVFYMSSRGQTGGQAEREILTMATAKIKAKTRFAETLPQKVKNPGPEFWQLLEVKE